MTVPAELSRGHLLRVLGFAFAVAICVGSIIGSGILRTPGAVADRVPEPWLILLLWALGGVHALLGANVVAELITSVPKAGGLYVPTRRAFGDFAGLVVGWSDWLLNGAAIAALALACADFAALITPEARAQETAIAIAILILLFGLNWLGIREGSAAQKLGSLAKFVLLVVLIGAIFLLVPPASEDAAAPVGAAPIGFFAMIVAYQLIYGAFSGWPNPIYFVEEDRNATTNIPKAMVLSILTVTAVYLVMNAALLHALPMQSLRTAELPAALSLVTLLGPQSTAAIAAIALVIVASCLNGLIMVVPRILYGLGRDGLFVPATSRVNAGGTPDIALFLSAALSMGLTLTGSFEAVFLFMGAITIFTMVITDVSLFALRRKEPGLERPFRARGYPALPALLLLLDLSLFIAMIAADPTSGVYMFALIALCVPVGWWLRRGRVPAPA